MGNQGLNGACFTHRDDGRSVDIDVGGLATSEYASQLNTKEAYYKEWDSLRMALMTGDVVLIRGSWLEEVYRRGDNLPMRQELPPEAIWSIEELMFNVKDHRKPTPQILSISYTWLSHAHPDPDSFHLRVFAPLLKHFARHCKIGVDSLAIFIDWCSLYQNPRSPDEQQSYDRALRTIDLWYAHWLVEVWLLTKVPDHATPYEDRGWPKFERLLATLTSPPESTLDLGLLRGGWKSWGQVANDCQAQRRPPETPENFTLDLQNKAFGVKEDAQFVSDKYREVFNRALGQEAQLWYTGLGWGDKEAQELAQLLPLCGRTLKDLELRGNEIGSAGAHALADALPLCETLERLSLDGNCIGREAQQHLNDVWQSAGKPRFGLEIGEQNFRPRGATPGMLAAVGGAGGYAAGPGPSTPGGLLAGGQQSAAASEQLNQLLARQAAFEARIESSVARLTDGLVEVADAVCARQRGIGGAGGRSNPGTPLGPMSMAGLPGTPLTQGRAGSGMPAPSPSGAGGGGPLQQGRFDMFGGR